MSGPINVSQFDSTNKTWTVTKDGQTFTVTDVNNNGIWDNKDLIKAPTGQTLSSEDLYEGMYQANAYDGVTEAEMKKYAEFTKLRDARDKAKEDQEAKEIEAKLAAYNAARPKKKNWLEKTMPWLNLGMQLTSFAGMVGMTVDSFRGCGNWQYNGCCNDNQLWSFSNMANTMLAMSTMATMMLPGIASAINTTTNTNNDLWSSLGLNLNSNASLSGTTTEQTSLDNWLNAQTKTEKQEETEYKETKKLVTELQTLMSTKASYIPDENETALSELDEIGKREYSEEEKATINKLTKFTYIPMNLIGDEEGKLTEAEAEDINAIIKNYVKIATADNEGIAKYENCKDLKSAYGELVTALKTGTDIEQIKTKAKALQAIKPTLKEDQE